MWKLAPHGTTRHLSTCAILAIVASEAIAGPPKANRNQQDLLQNRYSFEEDRSIGSPRYIWRHAGTVIELGLGGVVRILTSEGNEAQVRFVGANDRLEPRGEMLDGYKTIYYLGTIAARRTARHFDRIRYSGVYPGIDLVFVPSGDRFEYTFEIEPHADASLIRVRYEKCSIAMTPDGELKIVIGSALIVQRRPKALQNVDGHIQRIAC